MNFLHCIIIYVIYVCNLITIYILGVFTLDASVAMHVQNQADQKKSGP